VKNVVEAQIVCYFLFEFGLNCGNAIDATLPVVDKGADLSLGDLQPERGISIFYLSFEVSNVLPCRFVVTLLNKNYIDIPWTRIFPFFFGVLPID
jgi:hypothetical protein